jgi:hypothetical protein
MNQIIRHIEIAVCENPADVIFSVVLQHSGIRHSGKYRILDILCGRNAATSEGE